MAAIDLRAQGREAIRQAAIANNLPDDLIIISERWNTVAQLGDSGVIAKSAPIGHLARHDSARWYQQELDVCAWLAEKGAPVQRPFAQTISEHAGIPVSVWRWVPGEMGEASESQLVDSLAVIHRLGEGIALDQPWFATLTCHFADVFDQFRERRLVTPGTVRRMDDQYQHLMGRLDTFNLRQGFIHGDAQRKNAILNHDTAIWIDFEECSIGPLAWDLDCLAMRAEFDTDRILDRYAEVSGSERIPIDAIHVLQQLRDLEAMTWMIAIQEAREPAFQQATREMLDRWIATAG